MFVRMNLCKVLDSTGVPCHISNHGGEQAAYSLFHRCSVIGYDHPKEAGKLLKNLNVPPADVERICYLIGHHHTYHSIDGPDMAENRPLIVCSIGAV